MGRLLQEVEIGWMAGLFEGEGCIQNMHDKRDVNKGTRTSRLRIGMTDLDVLEKFQDLAGCGKIYTDSKPKKENHKQSYIWQVGDKANVIRLLLIMLPHFCERRKQKAIETLERYEK